MSLNNAGNINMLWASLIIEELVRNGVEQFCVAPGSRSAPLALAAAGHPKVNLTVHYDERGLGFFALGCVSATKKPAVVITTSGTAVANLFPSVIEASKKKLPLILLTADRPPELRATGANQTIDQNKIFGDYVRFYFDLPCPTKEVHPEAVLTTIDQAVFRASGELPGPVHLNCMFREPLTTAKGSDDLTEYLRTVQNWQRAKLPYTQYAKGSLSLSKTQLSHIAATINTIKNGIIVVGKIGGAEDQRAVLRLSEKLNWPVLPDISSGLRLGTRHRNIISYYDQVLLNEWPEQLKIDGILHLGGRMTSQRYYQLIKKLQPRHYLMVLRHPLRNDPTHSVSLRVQSGVNGFCSSLLPKLPRRSEGQALKYFRSANTLCEKVISSEIKGNTKGITEPAVCRMISETIMNDSLLFIANSMPVRDMDMYASPKGKKVAVAANRGASGIDGNIATACGASRASGRACTAVIGDLAFLHDLNSLKFLPSLKNPFVLVVLNNNGGGIFSFLPVHEHQEHFEKLFGTPHGLTFEAAAKLFVIKYVQVKKATEFVRAYTSAVKRRTPTMIEILTERAVNLSTHKLLQSRLRAAISPLISKLSA